MDCGMKGTATARPIHCITALARGVGCGLPRSPYIMINFDRDCFAQLVA
jgi:hypothetical protein